MQVTDLPYIAAFGFETSYCNADTTRTEILTMRLEDIIHRTMLALCTSPVIKKEVQERLVSITTTIVNHFIDVERQKFDTKTNLISKKIQNIEHLIESTIVSNKKPELNTGKTEQPVHKLDFPHILKDLKDGFENLLHPKLHQHNKTAENIKSEQPSPLNLSLHIIAENIEKKIEEKIDNEIQIEVEKATNFIFDTSHLEFHGTLTKIKKEVIAYLIPSISSYTNRAAQILSMATRIVGYIPIVGILAGISRIVELVATSILDHMICVNTGNRVPVVENKGAHLLRAMLELTGCGFVLIPGDLIVLGFRAKAEPGKPIAANSWIAI